MLTNFLVLTQVVKAVLHDVPLISSHKLDGRHVDEHQMPVVTHVSTPGFDSVPETSQSHGSLAMHRKLQLMESLTH